MREALFLTHNNIPFDVAFQLDDTTRAAFCIALTEMTAGKRFNWSRREFEDLT